MQFTYETVPSRVVFGRGTVVGAPGAELVRLGAGRVLVVVGEGDVGLARAATAAVEDAVAGWFTAVEPGVPAHTVRRAADQARQVRADALLAVGGGSATGTAKALARELEVPLVAVPTTYAGSTATPRWTITRQGRAESGTDPRALPRAVVLDPDVTDRLPRAGAVASGLDALAAVIETHWAPGANPITSVLADEAARALVAGLHGIGREGFAPARSPEQALADPVAAWAGSAARAGEDLLYGAHLAGVAAGGVGAGLHQVLAQALTTAFALPRAATRAALLPVVVAFNVPAAAEVGERLARSLGVPEPVSGLAGLYARLGAPRSLVEVGLDPRRLDEAVDRVAPVLPVANPRPVGRPELRAILEAALA